MGCETTTNCIVGGSALGSRKESLFETGKRAAKEIVDSVESRACVDQYVQVKIIAVHIFTSFTFMSAAINDFY